MDHLHRDLAPITPTGWRAIEEEAERSLRHYLAGRALVDFSGPHGWEFAAISAGRTTSAGPDADGVVTRLRQVQPLVEIRVPFGVSRRELEAADRGATNLDLDTVSEAARRAALAEDRAVFHGLDAAGIGGIAGASVHKALQIDRDYARYPDVVAQAVATVRSSGVDGPYALALGSRCYTGVVETTEGGGFPLIEHLRLILGGPVVWAPAVDGAVVVSQRGGDFTLVSGQDFSIGYLDHDASTVSLFLEESFTLEINDARAAIELVHRK